MCKSGRLFNGGAELGLYLLEDAAVLVEFFVDSANHERRVLMVLVVAGKVDGSLLHRDPVARLSFRPVASGLRHLK